MRTCEFVWGGVGGGGVCVCGGGGAVVHKKQHPAGRSGGCMGLEQAHACAHRQVCRNRRNTREVGPDVGHLLIRCVRRPSSVRLGLRPPAVGMTGLSCV